MTTEFRVSKQRFSWAPQLRSLFFGLSVMTVALGLEAAATASVDEDCGDGVAQRTWVA